MAIFGSCIVTGCKCENTLPVRIFENLHRSLCEPHRLLWEASDTQRRLLKRTNLPPEGAISPLQHDELELTRDEIGKALLAWAKDEARLTPLLLDV